MQLWTKKTEREFITVLSGLGMNFNFKVGQKVRLVSCPFSVNGRIGKIINLRPHDKWELIEVQVGEGKYFLYHTELRPLHLRDIYENR